MKMPSNIASIWSAMVKRQMWTIFNMCMVDVTKRKMISMIIKVVLKKPFLIWCDDMTNPSVSAGTENRVKYSRKLLRLEWSVKNQSMSL